MITVKIELNGVGRFIAGIVGTSIRNTGHDISEDSGLFSIHSILNDGSAWLVEAATLEQAENAIASEWAFFSDLHRPETSRDLDQRWENLTMSQKRAELSLRHYLAVKALRLKLRPGDRLRANKAECGAKEANFVFSRWDHNWIVSTGGASIEPGSVYTVNQNIIRV